MKCLMAAMASFLLCPNSANAQSPSADKVVPLTNAEAGSLLKIIAKKRGDLQSFHVREVNPDLFVGLVNYVLADAGIRAAVAKGYDADYRSNRKGDKVSNYPQFDGATYRDYVVQATCFFYTIDESALKTAIKKYEIGDRVADYNALATRVKTPGEESKSFDYYYAVVAYKEMKAVLLESAPSSASVEIDDVSMKKTTNDVYFVSKQDKHKIKFSLDQHKDHEVKDFDPIKYSELKVKLSSK